MKISTPRVLGLAAALLIGTSGIALATPSGTSVTNSIDLSYETGGVTITEDDAATVTFLVDTGVDLIVEGQDAGNAITVTQGQDPAVLTYRLENLSNADFGFDINVTSAGTLGLTYDAAGGGAAGTYFVAYGTSPTYDAGTTTVYNTAGLVNIGDLSEGDEIYIFIVGNIPTTAVDGASDTFTVTATALEAGTNTAVTESGTGDPAAVDVVFADPGADGVESDDETATVAAPDLTATKTQTLISENLDGTFNCATGTADSAAEAFIPGACVEYTITVTNGSGATSAATNLSVSDSLPSDVTYVTHDAGTFDSVTYAAPVVTGTEATLAPGDTVTFTVRATVNN